MDARRKVKKNGFMSITASFVAGNEPLKMITPNNPFSQPATEPVFILYVAKFTTRPHFLYR